MDKDVFEFEDAELPDISVFCPQAEFDQNPDSLFFNDGKRRIDFVLVYEDESKKDLDEKNTFQRRKVSVCGHSALKVRV